jgi:hypothetical protein
MAFCARCSDGRLEGGASVTHDELCNRGLAWLRGTRRCNPVYSRNASCREIPDAIGWSSSYKWHGSTVLECKTSVSDFYADKKKRISFVHRQHGWTYRGRLARVFANQQDFDRILLPVMGDFRFYVCESGLLTPELVEAHAADHGLIYVSGRKMTIVREAPRRSDVDKDSEIRYLRFAIINGK